MKLKAFTILIFGLCMNSLMAQTIIEGTTSIDVFDQDGMNDQVLSQQRPSCEMVKHRLQEYIIRTAEADLLLDWYSPQNIGPKQLAGLIDIYKRTPYFLNDRLYENVRVFYQWVIPADLFAQLKIHRIWGKEVTSSKWDWSDLYNGMLPPGFEFNAFERQEKIVLLSFNMSYETFCLENSDLTLKLVTPGQELVLKVTHQQNEL